MFLVIIIIIAIPFLIIIIASHDNTNQKYKPITSIEDYYSKDYLIKHYSVYKIYNTSNKKTYYGMTGDYEKRKNQHFDPLYWYKNKDKKLYKSMYYYYKKNNNISNFIISEIFCSLSKKEALYAEAFLINNLESYYNVNREKDNLLLENEIIENNPALIKELHDIKNHKKSI